MMYKENFEEIYYCEKCGYAPTHTFDCSGTANVDYKICSDGGFVESEDSQNIVEILSVDYVCCSECSATFKREDTFLIDEKKLEEVNKFCFENECSVYFVIDPIDDETIIDFRSTLEAAKQVMEIMITEDELAE